MPYSAPEMLALVNQAKAAMAKADEMKRLYDKRQSLQQLKKVQVRISGDRLVGTFEIGDGANVAESARAAMQNDIDARLQTLAAELDALLA